MGLLGLVAPFGALAQTWPPATGDLYPIVGWPNAVGGGVSCPQPLRSLSTVYGSGGATDPWAPDAIDIARLPNDVPPNPIPAGVEITITAYGVDRPVAPGPDGAWGGGDDQLYHFYAFGLRSSNPALYPHSKAAVAAPFIKVMQGRTYTFNIENHDTVPHLIDFHAIYGARGGPPNFGAQPGQTGRATFTFTKPGLFVYHCVGNGTPGQISSHISNGMSGLILVVDNPQVGGQETSMFKMLSHNAIEFYAFQNDMYGRSNGGVYEFDEAAMIANPSAPTWSVFNGRVGALIDYPMLAVESASHPRNVVIYQGATGNHNPAIHGIGLIWDWVFTEGDTTMKEPEKNIQTNMVPSAGSAIYVMDGRKLVSIQEQPGRPASTYPTQLDMVIGCQIPPDLSVHVDHMQGYFRRGALGLFATLGTTGFAGDSALCQ